MYQITSVAMTAYDKAACDLCEKYCTRVFNFDIKKFWSPSKFMKFDLNFAEIFILTHGVWFPSKKIDLNKIFTSIE